MIALLSVASGLAGLLVVGPAFGQPVGVLLFTGLPFLGLLVLSDRQPGLLFKRLRGRDIGVGIAFALLNLVATVVVAWLVSRLLQTAPPPSSP